MTGFGSARLAPILADTRARITALGPEREALERAAAKSGPHPEWLQAFAGPDVSVLAEVKRRSPSAGEIAPMLDPASHAVAYARGGAKAISVLTEPNHFGGSLDDLRSVRRAVGLPVLRKEFILDPIQLHESKAAGASAVLLIVRILEAGRLADLIALARQLTLGTLVEIHDLPELDVALTVNPEVIGVNSRDLDTFRVDVPRLAGILPHVPSHVVAVAESGLTDRSDVERAASWGADAVLIGSGLAAAQDPEPSVHALCGVERIGRN